MSSQFQNKHSAVSVTLRPRYGVIRGIYLAGTSNKTFILYNAKDATEIMTVEDERDKRIQRIAPSTVPISQHEMNIPFEALYLKVESDGNPDDMELTVLVD